MPSIQPRPRVHRAQHRHSERRAHSLHRVSRAKEKRLDNKDSRQPTAESRQQTADRQTNSKLTTKDQDLAQSGLLTDFCCVRAKPEPSQSRHGKRERAGGDLCLQHPIVCGLPGPGPIKLSHLSKSRKSIKSWWFSPVITALATVARPGSILVRASFVALCLSSHPSRSRERHETHTLEPIVLGFLSLSLSPSLPLPTRKSKRFQIRCCPRLTSVGYGNLGRSTAFFDGGSAANQHTPRCGYFGPH